MGKDKVLVIGSGGREHALAWKISQSSKVGKVYVAPGNGGTAAEFKNVDMNPSDFEAIVKFVRDNKINLTVVGPEAPLADGIVDYFNERDLRIFGPTQFGAQIEADKYFAKRLMMEYNIPTAFYQVIPLDERDTRSGGAVEFATENAFNFLDNFGGVVIKYPYLAGGKGAYVCRTREEAENTIKEITSGKFGKSDVLLLEEMLTGEEASLLAFVDGESVVPLLPAQDHKPVYDGDKGSNTGGMGAYAPAPIVDEEMQKTIMEEIMVPTAKALTELSPDGKGYKGILYAGLMMTEDGPKVLEFNCRFGDPETQPLMMLLESDLYEVMNATIDGKLNEIGDLKFKSGYAVTVVMASQGYPGKYEKGKLITELDKVNITPTGSVVDEFREIKVFHAGTKLGEDGNIYTNGGRVLGVTARAEMLDTAKDLAYNGVEGVHFENAYYRNDIADKGTRRLWRK